MASSDSAAVHPPQTAAARRSLHDTIYKAAFEHAGAQIIAFTEQFAAEIPDSSATHQSTTPAKPE